jgi:hypothetical protein
LLPPELVDDLLLTVGLLLILLQLLQRRLELTLNLDCCLYTSLESLLRARDNVVHLGVVLALVG